jgi:hypothetical protein
MAAMGFMPHVPPGMNNVLILLYVVVVAGAMGGFWKLLQRNAS